MPNNSKALPFIYRLTFSWSTPLTSYFDPQDLDGRSALHMACANGEIKVVKALMAKDIPADPLDKFGDAPLLIAAKKGLEYSV
jgi:ankyrin repeat protein